MTAAECENAAICSASGLLTMSSDGHGFIGTLQLTGGDCINVSLPVSRSKKFLGAPPTAMSIRGRVLPFPFGEDILNFRINGRPIGFGRRVRQIVAFVIGVLLSTLSYPATMTGASTDCSVGSECTVQGELQIYRRLPTSTGVIRLETDCWLLALPMGVWLKYDEWNKKKVIVTGEAFSNLAASDVIWFTVRDRRVAVGICDSPIVIYVKSIKKEP
jgi:hypothetical protein